MVSAAKAQRQKRSEELGQRLHELHCQVEEHSAILRQDPNAMAVAYDEYVAKAPRMGYTPALEHRDKYITDLEKVLEEEIDSVFLWVHRLCALFAT